MTERKMEQRRQQIHNLQKYYGMIPRDDSKLTRLFINSQTDETADAIAKELVATHFLYSNTLYGEMIETYMKQAAKRLRQMYPELSWKDTWKIMQFFGPISLKLLMISRCLVQIPERLTEIADSTASTA